MIAQALGEGLRGARGDVRWRGLVSSLTPVQGSQSVLQVIRGIVMLRVQTLYLGPKWTVAPLTSVPGLAEGC